MVVVAEARLSNETGRPLRDVLAEAEATARTQDAGDDGPAGDTVVPLVPDVAAHPHDHAPPHDHHSGHPHDHEEGRD